jgi:Uma2 family endonuclease
MTYIKICEEEAFMISLIDEEPMTLHDFLCSKYYKDGGWELIKGELVAMSPARAIHEEVVISLGVLFKTLLHDKRCRVYGSNTGLKIFEDNSWISPDLSICCDASIIEDGWFLRVPELVAEVLSASTKAYDLSQKRDIYREFGAVEYWAVDLRERWILVENFRSNKRVYYNMGDIAESELFKELKVKTADVFAD